ncbi:MAG TPA: histone deacetylase [Deltaproteobacteria bacterium]|nr:histone deacetylase [Deltaproteobacteria bacterium]
MYVFTSDHFVLPLPADHRFPMAKYAGLRKVVERVLPSHFLAEAPAVTDSQLAHAHSAAYLQAVLQGTLSPKAARRIGFPWSPALVARERRSVGGTLAGARAALVHGRGVNLAGGTHHAHPGQGGGFCLFNDAGVAIRTLQSEGLIERAMVVDCDVHQGDGTAVVFQGDASVFTVSIHGAKNYPFRKPPSSLDVPLPEGTTDATYINALEAALEQAFRAFSPDLVIYQSGVDPWEGDRLGTLALTTAGLLKRDQVVFGRCDREDVPVVVTMGGGYAPAIDDIVSLHAQTVFEALRDLWPARTGHARASLSDRLPHSRDPRATPPSTSTIAPANLL